MRSGISPKKRQKNKTKVDESFSTVEVGKTNSNKVKTKDSLEIVGGTKKGNVKAPVLECIVYYRGEVSKFDLSADFESALEIVYTVFKTNQVSVHYEDGDDFIEICNGDDWASFQSKKCDLIVKDKS